MEVDTQGSTLESEIWKFDGALVAQINDTLKQAAASSPNSAPISARAAEEMSQWKNPSRSASPSTLALQLELELVMEHAQKALARAPSA